MKKLRTALFCLAAAAALTCAASAAGVTNTTSYIGGANANVVYITPTDNTVVAPVFANGSVSTDDAASSIISGAPGSVVAAINGNVFNSYYSTSRAIDANTGNYPQIFSTIISEGKMVCSGTTVGLGFGYDGSIVIGRLSLTGLAYLNKIPFYAWNVNTVTNIAEPSAVNILTDEFDYPVNIPSGATIVGIADGRVQSMIKGCDGYVVPDGTTAVVIGSSYGTRGVKVGDSARYTFGAPDGSASRWDGMRNIIGGMGMIVENGASAVDNNPDVTAADQNPDVVRMRSFAAITGDGRLMLGTVSSSYRSIADSLIAMGITDAMSLDGGGSSMLYCGGYFPTQAGRKLASILAVMDPDGITGEAGPREPSTPSSWAKSAVDSARSLGIMPSSIDSHYRRSITRGEFCSLVAGYISAKTGQSIESYCRSRGYTVDPNRFYDTSDTDAVCAASLGIVAGYPDGGFHPDENILRQDAAIMLRHLVQLVGVSAAPGQPRAFADADSISSYAKQSVDYVSSYGIMSGNDDGTFGPQSNITREQAVVTVMYIWNKL